MKLTVLERVVTQGLLPEKGTFANIKLIRQAKESLSFTEAENKALNFRQEEGGDGKRTIWNPTVMEVDIELGEVATEMIKKELKSLDSKEELISEQISVYSKFVEE